MPHTSELGAPVQPEQLRAWLNARYPEPTRCALPGHHDIEKNWRTCEACHTYKKWRQRINTQFRRHGLERNPKPAEDPRPECGKGHTNAVDAAADGCEDCKAIQRWRHREYRRQDAAGIARRFTDIDRLREHLDALEQGGMLVPDIAKASGVSVHALWLLRGKATTFTTTRTAELLLAVPIPERKLKLVPNARGSLIRRIDATGTKRRIRCGQLAAHGLADQARKLGWTENAMKDWVVADTVTVDVADAVALLYPRLIAEPGTNAKARGIAQAKGYPEARYFAESNIDDPDYNPFQIVNNPFRVYRRLRALAYISQGPAQVGARIGEAPEMVELWMEGGPAPAYALHLVAEAYEELSGTPGPDQEAADRARRAKWASPLAWDDIPIDQAWANPCIRALPGTRAATLSVHSSIYDALDGRVTRHDLRHDELVKVVWILHRWRWSDRRIAAWLRWNEDGDLDKGHDAVTRWRLNNGITGFGALDTGANDDSLNGLILTPSAA